jgi:hypothetical protein
MRAVASAVALSLAAVFFGAEASAQQPALARAEDAYQNVDFEGTGAYAMIALREGGHSRPELVRIYTLLGIAAAALGREDEAREYFVRMLGLDIDAQLDDSVPPRLRDPYLEARGIWAARQGRLGANVAFDRAQSSLRIELTDPAQMSRRIRVHSRFEGQAQYAMQEIESRTSVAAPIAGASEVERVEYYVEILDEHRNVMLSEGTAFEPRVAGRMNAGGGGGGEITIFEEPLFWIIAGVVIAGAAAATAIVLVDQRSRIGAQTAITIGIE